MRRFLAFIVVLGIIAIAAVAMRASAQDGPPGGPGGGGPGGTAKPKPKVPGGTEKPKPKVPGGGFHLIPPFAVEQMNLTADQQEEIDELEKEIKAKLYKILTPEQKNILEEARPPRPGQGGPGGGPRGKPDGKPDGGPGRGGPGGAGPGGDRPSRPQRPASE